MPDKYIALNLRCTCKVSKKVSSLIVVVKTLYCLPGSRVTVFVEHILNLKK